MVVWGTWQMQSHVLLADPGGDRRLLSAFLRPPLRPLLQLEGDGGPMDTC